MKEGTMTIRQNIQESLIKLIQQERSQARFARRIGKAPQTVVNWIKGNNSPDIETLAAIADEYHLPISELLWAGKKDPNQPGNAYYLNEEEAEIVAIYRKCTPEYRSAIQSVVETLALATLKQGA